jgi:hypothetical protein
MVVSCELRFDLSRDVGLDYAMRQLFSSISYQLGTILRRVYDTCIKPTTMAKTVKLTKMAFNNNPYPTVSGSEGTIHINWLPTGNKAAQGHPLSPNCQRACEEGRINCQSACEDAII